MRDSGAGWEEMVAETRPWVCWVGVKGAAALRACHLQRCPDLASAAWGGRGEKRRVLPPTRSQTTGTNVRAHTCSIDRPEMTRNPN